MVYMFAPLSSSWTNDGSLGRTLDHVPWDSVSQAGKEWAVPFSAEDYSSEKGIGDMVVQDRMVEFTRRYYALHLRRDLTLLSHPEDSLVCRTILCHPCELTNVIPARNGVHQLCGVLQSTQERVRKSAGLPAAHDRGVQSG